MQNISYGEFNKINSIKFTSEYGKLKNIKLEGSTTQATRSGKNLLNLLKCSFSGCTLNSDNKSLTCNLNNQYFASIYTSDLNNWLLGNKGKTITFSTGTPLNKNTSIVIYGTRSNGSKYQEANETGTGKCSITIANDFTTITSIELRFNRQGTTFTDTTTVINYAMLELGAVATDYEEYGVMPSPDYPSPIENVEGKNKLDYKTVSNTSNTVVSLIENGFNVKGKYAGKIVVNGLKQNTDYNLQYILQNITGNTHNVTIFANQETTTTIKIFSTLTGGKFNTGNYTEINIWFYANLGRQGEANFTNIQLEEGTVATPYVPYNSLEVKVENKNLWDNTNVAQLNKVSYQNGIYTASDNDNKSVLQYKVQQYTDTSFIYGTQIDKTISGTGIYYFTGTKVSNAKMVRIGNNGATSEFIVKYSLDDIQVGEQFTIALEVTDTTIGASKFKNVMLLKGAIQSSDYEPHQSQIVYFPLGEEKLMKGDYLADDGIHHKRKQVVLDGSDDENWHKSQSYNGSYYASQVLLKCVAFGECKCDFFKKADISNPSQIKTNYQLGTCFIENDSGIFDCWYDDGTANLANWKTWLSEHPITVEYELAEEEIVPYTEAQQEAWNKIKNFPIFIGQNNLTSTALLSAIYIKKITTDTKVDYNLYNEDYIKIATKNNIHPKFKIQMLDEYENVIDEITGDISRDNSGSISNNYQQGVRRSVSLTFIDTEGKFLPDSNSNLIWANKKFKLFSGLLDTDTNEIFWFSEGIYYFSNVSSSRNGADKLTTVNGVDKFGKFGSELGYNQLESTYLIPAGTKIYDAIKGILNIDIGNGYPIDPIEPVLDPLYIDEVCPYDISKSPSSYLSEMLIELADIIGCDIYYDADGRLHVDSGTIDFSYSNKPSIWDFSDVLPEYMNPSINTNFAEFINTVKVVGNNTNDKTYEYTAVNNNPESPTRVDLIGTKSTYIESASVYNTDRAKDYAEYKLNMFSILQLAVTFSCTFLPHLDVNKVITITDSYYKYEKQRFVIQSITLPLSYDGVMSISACNVASLPYYEGGN